MKDEDGTEYWGDDKGNYHYKEADGSYYIVNNLYG